MRAPAIAAIMPPMIAIFLRSGVIGLPFGFACGERRIDHPNAPLLNRRATTIATAGGSPSSSDRSSSAPSEQMHRSLPTRLGRDWPDFYSLYVYKVRLRSVGCAAMPSAQPHSCTMPRGEGGCLPSSMGTGGFRPIADIRGVAPHLPEAERRPPPDRLRRAYTPMIWRAVPCHHCVSHSRFTTTDAAK